MIGDSLILGIKGELLSNKKYQVKVSCRRGAAVKGMFDYVKTENGNQTIFFAHGGLIAPKV